MGIDPAGVQDGANRFFTANGDKGIYYYPIVSNQNPTVSISPPTTSVVNTPFTVSWSSQNASSVVTSSSVISPTGCNTSPLGVSEISGTRSVTCTASGLKTFQITVANSSGAQSVGTANVSVGSQTILTPITVNISASPTSITLPTNTTRLTWTTTGNPTSCVASGSWSGSDKSPTGGYEDMSGMTAGTRTFIITCSKSGTANAVSFASVTINPASVVLPTANQNPIGYLDGITNGYANGWTVDPNLSTQSINVHAYIDGSFVEQFVANSPSDDVRIATGYTGNHRFSWRVPDKFRDGKTHSLYVYAINVDSLGVPIGDNISLPLSTASGVRTFQLGSSIIPTSLTITVNISASPTSITLPTNTTRITWTTTGSPTKCTAYGKWGGFDKSPTGGYEDISGLTVGTHIFSMTCSKAGAVDYVAFVSVVVNPVTIPITTNPSITIISPNGGEILKKGDNVTVQWNRVGTFVDSDPNRFYFVFLKNKSTQILGNSSVIGVTYYPIYYRVSALNYPSFTMVVPQELTSGQWYLEIDYADAKGVPVFSDTSNASFTLVSGIVMNNQDEVRNNLANALEALQALIRSFQSLSR